MYVTVAAVIVIGIIVAAFALTGWDHRTSAAANGEVLLPAGTGYSIVQGQFSGVTFLASSESTVAGTLNSSSGVQIYIMTPAQFEKLSVTDNVSGYVWTSGVVADEVNYDLQVTVSPGQWVLAFLDPTYSIATGVGFYSDVTLTPT